MSAEERDLLARIGQLAGQINRHKSHQAGAAPYHHQQRTGIRRPFIPDAATCDGGTNYKKGGNAYRGRGAYPGAAYRIGRPPTVSHRHRTLHLNPAGNACDSNHSSPGSTPGNSGWVSRIDRHRQLINANVYEKESQSRVKAIEETRQKKLRSRKNYEKLRFNDYLRNLAGTASATANFNPTTGRNELMIEGIRFLVADGGKKLVKSPGKKEVRELRKPVHQALIVSFPLVTNVALFASADDRYSTTPKTAVVAGVKFHRTKTGNLVANRIVQTQRYVAKPVAMSMLTMSRRSGNQKKVSQPCKIFSTTGSCPKGPSCRYQHDPTKVAICRDFLKDGKCPSGESCDLSHETTHERMPDCLHYAKGHCTNPDCLYTHSKAGPSALVCEAFGYYGFCDQGADCTERHVYECPDFSNTGTCKTKGCKLLHRERASLLRHQVAKADEDMDEDVSSDEEAVGSDDVDSDDVAEYIEAESDDSDFEHAKDFIPL
ncbi:hypothetical protein E4U55_007166 [Claviceps digitariae]|nr:hypothetical protein E4U55_007166 [Claviceps digitariae]